MIVYDYGRQRIINRSNGRTHSIKPLYLEESNKYNTFYKIWERLLKLSIEFPQEKFVVEINNMSESDYDLIVSDIGIGENFTDHVSKFYLSVTVNAIIIVHKVY